MNFKKIATKEVLLKLLDSPFYHERNQPKIENKCYMMKEQGNLHVNKVKSHASLKFQTEVHVRFLVNVLHSVLYTFSLPYQTSPPAICLAPLPPLPLDLICNNSTHCSWKLLESFYFCASLLFFALFFEYYTHSFLIKNMLW